MICGIGVDTVEIARVARALAVPGFGPRVFTASELELPLASIAARWAAREAAVKALGGLRGLTLRELSVPRETQRAPQFELDPARLAPLGVARLHLSLTHDAGTASAFVIAEALGA